MTTRQERYVNMYKAIEDYLNRYLTILKDLPNFEGYFNSFKNTIKQLMLIAEMQKDTSTGAAKEKKRLKDNLTALASDNSVAITAYAKFTNNDLLLDQVNFSDSDLLKMTAVELKNYAQVIYNKVEANIGQLAPYGITIETLKTFNDAIIVFDASIAKPRVGINEKAKITSELGLLFDIADSTLKNIDTAVKIIRRREASFYKGYLSNRRLVNTGSGMLALKATAKVMISGEPVHGATFTFIHESKNLSGSNGNGNLIKKTSKKGNFHIKNMKAGIYKVVVNKAGFKVKEEKVNITDGERSKLVVEMEKA